MENECYLLFVYLSAGLLRLARDKTCCIFIGHFVSVLITVSNSSGEEAIVLLCTVTLVTASSEGGAEVGGGRGEGQRWRSDDHEDGREFRWQSS